MPSNFDGAKICLLLYKYRLKRCATNRLIELMHDFFLFDGGVKSCPCAQQYFGLEEARAIS